MIRRHESGSQDRRESKPLGVAIRSLSVSHLFARVFASEVHTPDADPLCRSASPRAVIPLSFISTGLRPPRKRVAYPAMAWRRIANARRGRNPTLATNGGRCSLFTRTNRSIKLGRDSAGLYVLRRDVTRSGTRQQNGHAEWKKFIAVAGCSVNCFSRQRCEGKTVPASSACVPARFDAALQLRFLVLPRRFPSAAAVRGSAADVHVRSAPGTDDRRAQATGECNCCRFRCGCNPGQIIGVFAGSAAAAAGAKRTSFSRELIKACSGDRFCVVIVSILHHFAR